ncbi:MAG: glycosyltransferase [Rhodocyclaceae bacterium]|nr:glycosyltransferase [Rhodocyclaceae bacterium]
MKLLIITYSYTPDLTPRAFRWSAVAAQWVQMGHEVHVLCASQGPTAGPDDGVTIYRVRDWLLNASARVTPGVASAQSTGMSARIDALRALFRKAIRALWRALYWPDYACGWVIPATRAAHALCAANHYDWIVSVSHPFTGHVVGMLAKGRAPASRWLVDIGDPFYLMKEPSPNNRHLYAWISRAIEHRVVAGADMISVTTESTRWLYEANFPLPADKVQVVPPLLSLPESPPPSPRAEGRPIRLVFVGTLYRNLRSPKFLLACFAALIATLPERQMELHFYGAINDCAENLASVPESLKPALFVHGMVGRGEVLQAMLDADVLVNIGNNSESQLASKVIEYMAVGKPILNLVGIADDVSVATLANYPAALTIMRSNDTPSVAVVDALCAFVLHPPGVSPGCVEAVRQRYSTAHVAGLYAAMLETEEP